MKQKYLAIVMSLLMFSFVFATSGTNNISGQQNIDSNSLNNSDSINQMNKENGNSSVQSQNGNTVKAKGETATQLREKLKSMNGNSSLNIEEKNGSLMVRLSNGKDSSIKIMPETASETAIQILQIKNCNSSNNCSIELKEVGSGNQTKLAYEVKAQKESRILGIFKTNMSINAEVDAETGEVISTKKAWWAFLSSE